MDRVFEMDFDIIPVGKLGADGLVAWNINGLEQIECLVGKHDTEPECVIRLVALDNGHIRFWPIAFHQQRKVKPRWSAARHCYAHLPYPVIANYFRSKIISGNTSATSCQKLF